MASGAKRGNQRLGKEGGREPGGISYDEIRSRLLLSLFQI